MISSLLMAQHHTSYGVYISQLIHFARGSSHVADFNTQNKLLNKAIGIVNFAKLFSTLYRRFYHLITKFHVRLNSHLRQGFSELESYGDLKYELKKMLARIIFSAVCYNDFSL